MTYARYKFQKAISELSRNGSLRERLIDAYLINLMHIDLTDLPESVRNDFFKFKYRIVQNRQNDNSRMIESAFNRMEESDIKRLTDALFTMYAVIAKQDDTLDHVA